MTTTDKLFFCVVYISLGLFSLFVIYRVITMPWESVKQEICNRDNCATFKEIETNDMCSDELCEIIEEEK